MVCSFFFFPVFLSTSQMHIIVAACAYFHFLISFQLPILSNGFDCLIACRLNVSNLNWFQTGKYVSIYRSNDWDFQPDVATTTNLSNFRRKNWQKLRLFFGLNENWIYARPANNLEANKNKWKEKKEKQKQGRGRKFYVKRNRKILKYQFSLGKQIFFDSSPEFRGFLSFRSVKQSKTKQSNNWIWMAFFQI